MQIATKTVTTKVHQAVASADDLKKVAVSVVMKQLGLADGVVLSTSAEVQTDGSIAIEVIESVPDATPTVSGAALASPLPAFPAGLQIPTV